MTENNNEATIPGTAEGVIHGKMYQVAGIYFDLSPRSQDEALALVDEIPEEKLRIAYGAITGDPVPRSLDAVTEALKEVVRIEHYKVWGRDVPAKAVESAKEAIEEAEHTIARKAAPVASGRVRIDHVLTLCREEGITEPERVLEKVNDFLRDCPAEQLTIKDVTIQGILEGKNVGQIVTKLHQVFDPLNKEVRSGKNEVAFYRSRLRSQYGVQLPKAPRDVPLSAIANKAAEAADEKAAAELIEAGDAAIEATEAKLEQAVGPQATELRVSEYDRDEPGTEDETEGEAEAATPEAEADEAPQGRAGKVPGANKKGNKKGNTQGRGPK